MALRICLLGAFQLWRDGTLIGPEAWSPYKKAKALLTILLIERGRLFTPDELIEYLWPDADAEKAARNLRARMSELRRFLEPQLERGSASSYILTRPQGYLFNPEADCTLDTEEFLKHQQRAQAFEQAGQIAPAVNEYEAAVQLYRGELVADARFADWVFDERARWRKIYLDLLERLADCHARSGQLRRAIARCHQVLEIDKYRESTYRQLMLFNYLLDEPAQSQRLYEQCQNALSALGVEPTPATQELHRQMLARHVPGLDQVYRPALKIERQAVPRSLKALPFVGREVEYATLLSGLEAARAGEGRVILVAGEAGVGKSRLMREILRYAAHERQALILEGHGYEIEAPLALYPIGEALRRGVNSFSKEELERFDASWLAEIADLLPELRAKLPGLPVSAGLPPDLKRARLFEGLSQFLLAWARREAATRPLVLALDDLQWADPSTFDFLQYLAPRLRREPILILGNYRVEAVIGAHPLLAFAREGAAKQTVHTLTLKRLRPEHVERLLKELSPNHPKLQLFSQRLYEETEGNALFIVSVLQSLFEQGILRLASDGTWTTEIDDITKTYKELMIPTEVKKVILQRVARLTPEEQELLQLASVLGRSFTLPLLEHVWPQDSTTLIQPLERLVQAQILVEPNEHYEFGHDKIREIVYQELSAARRKLLHKRVGQILETRYSEKLENYHGLLAHHYANAGEEAQAIEHGLLALNAWVEKYQFQAGLGLAKRILNWIRAREERAAAPDVMLWQQRFDVLSKRVEMYDLWGRRTEQEQDIAELFEWAGRLQDTWRLSEAYLKRSQLLCRLSRYAEAREEGLQSVALKSRLEDRRGEAQALRNLGLIYYYLRDYDQALEVYQRALSLTEALGDQRGRARVLNSLAAVHSALADYEQVHHYAQQAYELSRAVGEKEIEGAALNNIALCYTQTGEYTKALAHFEQVLVLRRAIGDRRGETIALGNLGSIFDIVGQYSHALGYRQQVLEICRETGDRRGEGTALDDLANTYLALGETEAALSHQEAALALWRELNNELRVGRSKRELGRIISQVGQTQRALQLLGEALHTLRQESGARAEEMLCLSYMSEAHFQRGQLQAAREASTQAVQILSELQDVGQMPRIYLTHFRILAAVKEEKREEAWSYLEKAYQEVMRQAGALKDPEMKRSFLENVPEHREILKEWTQRQS